MSVEIIAAGVELKPVVLNLGQCYIHDFTDFLGFRCGEDGLFRTDYWEKYWAKPNHWAFLVKSDGELAGFVLVGPDAIQSDTQFNVGEFFIMRKFRRRGLGQQVAFDIFDRFQGRWEVQVVVENTPALAFWRKVIDRYTDGDFKQLPEPVKNGQFNDWVYTFDNTPGAS